MTGFRVEDLFASWKPRARRVGGLSNTPPRNATSKEPDAVTPRTHTTADASPGLFPVRTSDADEGTAKRHHAPATELAALSGKALACRLDALCVAYRVTITDELWALLRGHREEAAWHRGGEFGTEIRGVPFALHKRLTSDGSLRFVNGDATVLVCQRRETDDSGRYVGPGWSVEVSLRAMYLARHSRAEAAAYTRELARAFGDIVGDERLRRIDWAADAELADGVTFSTDDRDAFAGRSQSVHDYEPSADADERGLPQWEHAIRTHWKKDGGATAVTGFSFSPGADFQARLYNKSAELLRYETDHDKYAVEKGLWGRGGWEGRAVWRLEFQARREALREMHIETFAQLELNIDSAWAYATRKWLRLTDPATATRRHRRKEDDRWLAFQAVVFSAEAEPLKRVRGRRGGPSKGQALGTMQCYLAALGYAAELLGVDGKPREPAELLRENVARFGDLISVDLDSDYLFLCAAKRARFASVDDGRRDPLAWRAVA